jgi:hypothetical protein
MRYVEKGGDRMPRLVSASEIACWAYCPEQWRLQYGLGLAVENQGATDAGKQHHACKVVAEWMAGGAIAVGRLLVAIAAVLLLLWWWS